MKAALLLVLAFPAVLHAQTEPADVVKRLFDAMRLQDTAAMRANFHPDMRLVFQGRDAQGNYRVGAVPVERWLGGIKSAPAKTDERLFDIEQRVDGPMATVWTRYEFWLGENFSHCGYDAFQLIQMQGEWKIIAGADTQRRDPAACGRGTVPVPAPKLTAADTAAVLAPIQKLFDAMRTRDTTAARSVFIEQARLLAHTANPQHRTVNDFLGQISRPGADLRERILKPTEVRIDDNLATVWTFYDFHVGEQFSHCGIDYAQLVKTPDGWKIAQLSWTTRREGCERVSK